MSLPTSLRSLTILFLLTLGGCSAQAQVIGRYIYYGNALSEPMGLVEVEVYSNGENVIHDKPEVFTQGLDYGFWMIKRTPEQREQMARALVDGDTDTAKRVVDFASKVGGGYKDITLRYSSLEIDLGHEEFLDSVSIYRSRHTDKQWGDLGWRILAVLDADRQVIAWSAFNVYGDDWKKNGGRYDVTLTPLAADDPLAGRVVPEGVRSWLSEAEYITHCLGKEPVDLVQDMSAEEQARLDRFQRRNDPAELDALGRRFFRLVDVERPELAAVKALVEAEKYAEALEAFKAPFIKQLEPLTDWNGGEGTSIYVFYSWTTEPHTRYTGRARDLRNHLYADRKELEVKRFVPGLLPPAKLDFPFQMRPLLLHYAVSGSEEDLRLWEAMTDDWSMGFQDAADKAPEKLRDYFVLDPGMRGNLKDLYMASVSQPDFLDKLNGATLARFLMPVLEEIPVANWRVTRKVNFNHTYNCIPGGLYMAALLDQFYAGQRLGREMQQGWERTYTLSLYRDGSMVEIGDEGHYLATVVNPTNLYGWYTHVGRPAWFTPAMETYFLDHFRANILSHVRNVAPHGTHVRWSASTNGLESLSYELDIKDPYWRNVAGGRMAWGDYYPTVSLPILKEPQPRAVIDTVYGRGRPEFELNNKRKDQVALLETYPGEYTGEPSFLSDWMPYTGLWYFRGGWDHEASFLHMVKPGHPNNMGGAILYPVTNRYGRGQFNDTTYRFSDYATPLITGMGVLIDGLEPCPEEGRTPSGSKQDVFTQAREKPMSSRWHTDAQLDFGEAEMQTNYRNVGLVFNHKTRESEVQISEDVVEDVSATRQIIQVRPARLFLQVDRLRFSDDQPHTQTLEDTLILISPNDHDRGWFPEEQLQVDADAKTITTQNADNPGLTVARFGQPELTMEASDKSLAHGSFGRNGSAFTLQGKRPSAGRIVRSSWQASGETVLLSLLRAQKPDEAPIQAMTDLSTQTVVAARVEMTDGTVVSIQLARQAPADLALEGVTARGELLLLVQAPEQAGYGLLLGAESLAVNGAAVALSAPDVRITLDQPAEQVVIRRPLDPPTIGPAINTFIDTTTVNISSESEDVDIYYIVEPMADPAQGVAFDGTAVGDVAGVAQRASAAATDWQLYAGPFTIDESSFVRARVIRRGVEDEPFTAAGTDVSAISYGFFRKRPLQPAVAAPATPTPGLTYDYLEDRWFALWTYTDQLEPVASGTTETLLDVSMRQTDDAFAVRYSGYITVPADGVYTFHGPEEYVNNLNAPGYDLRVFIDGEEWYLTQVWHGRGAWSIPLQAGTHEFRVTFADSRYRDLSQQPLDLWRHYPWAETTWKGTAPVLEVSGPDLPKQPIPAAWLTH